MKTIGIVADTHSSPLRRRVLPAEMLRRFASVDFILHAGDVTGQSVLNELNELAPVLAVRGNNDPSQLVLPLKRRIETEGIAIGLVHGDEGVGEHVRSLKTFHGNGITAANALSQFETEDDMRFIVFGHSHNPMIADIQVKGRTVTLFNPGSPTDKRWGQFYGFGILRVDGTRIETELVTWE